MFKFKRLLKERTIDKMAIPSPADIMANKKRSFFDQIKGVKAKPFYAELAQELLDELPPEEAISGLLQLRCYDLFSKRNY